MTQATDSAEEWRPIPGYEGRYDVSNQGRVRSWLLYRGKPGPRIRALTECPNGYWQVKLQGREFRVYFLVAAAFIGPRPDGFCTRHLDGNPKNDRPSNLAYGTPSENNFDRVRHGRHPDAQKTHCKHGHPFDAKNTAVRYRAGMPSRQCIACKVARDKARDYSRKRVAA